MTDKEQEKLGKEALDKIDEATKDMTDTLKKARAERRPLTKQEKERINHLNSEVTLADYLVQKHIFKRTNIKPRKVGRL